MWDFKRAQLADGKRYLSSKMEHEYDCKRARIRNLSITGYSGHKGTGKVVNAEDSPDRWEAVPSGSVTEALRNFACGKK